MLVPLAIEYVFWNESRPELLLRVGTPLAGAPGLRAADWTIRLETALTETMDALATDARAREPARFARLLLGRAGVGGPYDAWRRLRARLAGQDFSASHGEEA